MGALLSLKRNKQLYAILWAEILKNLSNLRAGESVKLLREKKSALKNLFPGKVFEISTSTFRTDVTYFKTNMVF